MLIKLLQPLEL